MVAATNTIAHPQSEACCSDAESVSTLGLPATVVEAILPGYSVFASFLLRQLGIDISFWVSLCALCVAFITILRYISSPVIDFLLRSFSSSIIVEEYDDIYPQVLDWLGAHKLMQDLRELRVHTRGQCYDDSEDEEDDDQFSKLEQNLPDDTIFNFRDWTAHASPRYEPNISSGFFLYKGFFVRVVRDERNVGNTPVINQQERLIMTVIWRSTRPLKSLIHDARELYLGKRNAITRIRRPVPKEKRGERNEWHTVAVRPSRAMSTVVLDNEQKAQVLVDMNDFLHPKTAKWYANRGIPYRRGYLFHGAPGTGKSSLSYALAGLFGLEIFCLSLSEVNLTEEDLLLLLNTIPKRCIVLLEDIDSAGISRPKPAKDKKRKKARRVNKSKFKRVNRSSHKAPSSSSSGSGTSDSDSDSYPPARYSPGKLKLENAITISGLLNAIDGVTSPEGRVLIMTTNFPDRLDDALVRPGRVDLKVEFKLAGTAQIKELFLRMYGRTDREEGKSSTISQVINNMDFVSASSANSSGSKTHEGLLDQLADSFAHALPEGIFSPAEIQGYLVMRKRSPEKALAEVTAWRDDVIAKRKVKGSDGHMGVVEGHGRAELPKSEIDKSQ